MAWSLLDAAIALAQAEAMLEGGHAPRYQRVQEAWDLVQRGEALDLAAIARHHFQLQPHIVEDVGRVMLGFAPRSPLF